MSRPPVPAARRRRALLGQRQDDRRHGPDGRASPRGDSPCPRTRSGPTTSTPGYHALAAGRPGRNLDAYLCGAGARSRRCSCTARRVRRRRGRGRDGAVRRRPPGQGSWRPPPRWRSCCGRRWCWSSTRRRSRGRWRRWCTGSPPSTRRCGSAGVILNQVASDRHEELLREALDAAGVPVLGGAAAGAAGGHALAAPRAGAGRRTAGRGGRGGRARWRAGGARVRPARPCSRWPGAPGAAGTAWDPAGALSRPRRPLPSRPPGVRRRVPARPVVALAGGAGVHLLLRRARGAADRRGRRGSRLRPAARRATARRDGRAGDRRRVPRGVRRRAVRQRAAAQGRRRARGVRGAGRRRVRGAAVSVPGARRAPDVRGARRARPDVGTAHPRLPRRRRRERQRARAGRHADARARVPPDGRRAGGRGRSRVGCARPRAAGRRASYNKACTRVICTRTGRPSPVWPVGSSRGAGRHEQQAGRSRGGSRGSGAGDRQGRQRAAGRRGRRRARDGQR